MCKQPHYLGNGIYVNCGQCLYCKLKRAREWTIRCLLEYSEKTSCHMVTLTYRDNPGTLVYEDVQNLFKKMRNAGYIFSYLVAGEYGSRGTFRPHYHVLFFGLTHKEIDVIFGKNTVMGTKEGNMWRHGFVHVGYVVSSKMIAYVTQYTMKKLKTKEYADGKKPPFIHMSKGIGSIFLKKESIKTRSLIDGYILWNNYKYPIPRYYFKKLDIDRQNYYQEYILEHQEKLVDNYFSSYPEALQRSPFVVPEKGVDQIRLNSAAMADAFYKGNVLYYKGEWRITTEHFEEWLTNLRNLHELKTLDGNVVIERDKL